MPDIFIDTNVLVTVIKHSVQFLCLAIIFFFFFRLWGRTYSPQRPLSLNIIVALLMASALYDTIYLLDYDYIRWMFNQLPDRLFYLRYGFSFFLRLYLLITAFGLMSLKEIARKAIIALAIFTILTIYWKHPFYVFENIAIMVEQNYFEEAIEQLKYPMLPWISMFFYVTADLIIAGLIIFYFTLPETRAYFKDKSEILISKL